MRAIDADDFFKQSTELYEHAGWDEREVHFSLADLRCNLEMMPTVEAEPVRHGKWKQWDSYGFENTYECTACGESFVLIEGTPITNGYKYCPSCGAKMDGEHETD